MTASRASLRPVQIRRYRPSDRAFYARSLGRLQDHLWSLDRFGVVRHLREARRQYADLALTVLRRHHGRILIAERDGRPVGFVAAYVRPRNRMRDLELRPGRDGFVMDLYVVPSARRGGVGTVLLRAAERYLVERRCERVWLDVFVPNERAHALYRRLGYADFGLLMTAPLARPAASGRRRAHAGRSSK